MMLLSSESVPVPRNVPAYVMQGLGNRLIVMDLRCNAQATIAASFAAACGRFAAKQQKSPAPTDQYIGLRCDAHGLVMDVRNRDGSSAGQCGNAARAIALLLAHKGEVLPVSLRCGNRSMMLEHAAAGMARVDMGPALFDWESIPLACDVGDVLHFCINPGAGLKPVFLGAASMGNPHAVFFAEETSNPAALRDVLGPLLVDHPLFPEGANISVVRLLNESALSLFVHERGVGPTLACGSAACAAAAIAFAKGIVNRCVRVLTQGGEMFVSHSNNGSLLQSGPVEILRAGDLSTLLEQPF